MKRQAVNMSPNVDKKKRILTFTVRHVMGPGMVSRPFINIKNRFSVPGAALNNFFVWSLSCSLSKWCGGSIYHVSKVKAVRDKAS